MGAEKKAIKLYNKYVIANQAADSDYFSLIKELLAQKDNDAAASAIWQDYIARTYTLIEAEIRNNQNPPVKAVSFGTSGWRGTIGKDLTNKSIGQVSLAIVEMYEQAETDPELALALGINNMAEAQERGCIIGYDNRFGGPIFAQAAIDVLSGHGFKIYFAGESTTGVLSAAVLELKTAFSINLTPSHNPLEYGGFKFNAADAGPAAALVTQRITANTHKIIAADRINTRQPKLELVADVDALGCWINFVKKGAKLHGLDIDKIMAAFASNKDMIVAVDCVHGASRIHIDRLFNLMTDSRLIKLRVNQDYTFGGISPEPSSANMQGVIKALNQRPEPLKLGMIIDPDGDRIRFTDGRVEVDMNQFGAMGYHYLHEIKAKKGLVAKNVATSNFANCLAQEFNEEVYESKVGFKEFKPVIGKALVFFEESDGISMLGHTPEKDAYIGLLLALDMVLNQNKNLGDYLAELEEQYGYFYPARDGVVVAKHGDELLKVLASLDTYKVGSEVAIGAEKKKIIQVIDIDGRKMIFADGSWIMIRPSGTEPKVRFYVEARDEKSKGQLFQAARDMLAIIGLL